MIVHDRRITAAAAIGAPALPGGRCGGARPALARRLLAGCCAVTLAVAHRRASGSAGAASLRDRLVRPLQTISNLLAALREGDFSIRARDAASPTTRSAHVMLEINTLADTLRAQRLGAQEATALLRAVMAEIDVAIFAFDAQQRLALVNRYGERLLGATSARSARPAPPRSSASHDALQPASTHPGSSSFPGGAGRWEIRRTQVLAGRRRRTNCWCCRTSASRCASRSAGVAAADSRDRPRAEQLARADQVDRRQPRVAARPHAAAGDWRDDMERGLARHRVARRRAQPLHGAYARLARLPPPDAQAGRLRCR